MTGAVPCMFIWIPFQRTAQMRAALFGEGKEIGGGFQAVNGKLWPKDRPGGRKYRSERAFPFLDQITKEDSCRHGGSDSPFLKTRGDKKPGRMPGVVPDIRDLVQGHAVLRRPSEFFPAVWIVSFRKIGKRRPSAALFSGTMALAA